MTKRVTGSLPLLCMWVLATSQAIRRDQGVPDARALVGRIFDFKVPRDAFEGKVLRYEVAEAGELHMPSWLQFDQEGRTFMGVPSSSDVGQHYISIKAIGKDSTAKDVFSIEVAEEESTSSSLCPNETPIEARVVLDVALSEMEPSARLRTLKAMASIMELPEERFHLAKDDSPFDPSKALRAGPGNALHRDSTEGAMVRFEVGCGATISPEGERAVSALKKSASNGELSDAAGRMVIGWQVSSGAERSRRHVTPFRGTPVPRIHVTYLPRATERVPEARIVPTAASPRFLPTDHRHRHGHGHDPLRREFPSPTPEATPEFRLPDGGTPLPTPVPRPEIPTVAILPTRIPEMPEETAAPPSRWYVSEVATAEVRPTRTAAPPTVEPTRRVVPNFRPTVNNRLKKLSLVAGKTWRYVVPADTFVDLEDGNARDLKLMFTTSERAAVNPASWIQFDPERQSLYALPLSGDVDSHEYVLEAMDSEGASTFDRVRLDVWQHPASGAFTHRFSMTVRYNKWQYPVGIDWQIELLERVARIIGDQDTSNIALLSVTLDPVRISWANDSLPIDTCPEEEIRRLLKIIATADHHPTREVKRTMAPEFRVQDIGVEYGGACVGVVTTPPPPVNAPPTLQQPISNINMTVGDVLNFKIPEATFHDLEDGSTRNLRLGLIPNSSWIRLDPITQILYGLPTEDEDGRYDFRLTAVDSDGQTAVDAFVVYVERLPLAKRPPLRLSVRLKHDYDTFDTGRRVFVAHKIARLYDDPGPQHVLVLEIAPGSVLYTWSNKTLPLDRCPRDLLKTLVRRVVTEEGTPTSLLVEAMSPEFTVMGVGAEPTGVCLKVEEPPLFVTPSGTEPSLPSLPPHEPTLKPAAADDDLYVTTVVPAAVIAAMLVIAAVVAYLLYWKKRKGKGDDGGVGEFTGTGVPVVFAGELEETKPDLGKTPAIMKNEKPPLEPSFIRRGDVPYKPPPPFAPPNKQPKRPKTAQAYRHATYVPP